jgi:GTP-binding protein HflX
VWNKIGNVGRAERERLENLSRRTGGPAGAVAASGVRSARPVLVSALTGEGIGDSTTAIENELARTRLTLDVALDPADGAGMSWVHRHAEVLARDEGADGRMHMRVRVAPDRAGMVRAKFGAENIRASETTP